MQIRLDEYDNSWYKPGSTFKRICWFYVNIIFLKHSLLPNYRLKVFLLRLFGAKTGNNVLIKPGVNIKYPWFLKVGSNVWIGEDVWIDNLGLVTIGSNVCLSQGSLLLSGNHDYTSPRFNLLINEIHLGDGVWIGAKAIVCGGTTCGEHAVLTAGSVATGKLEPFGIYKGNPAVKVKERILKQ